MAICGHALSSQAFYETCTIWGVSANWFLDEFPGGLWKAMRDFWRKWHRHPTTFER